MVTTGMYIKDFSKRRQHEKKQERNNNIYNKTSCRISSIYTANSMDYEIIK